MKLKKLLSITLALLMVFSLCPHGAFSLYVNATTTKSGTTGNCTWKLEGTKLTISGKGKMGNYTYEDDGNKAPWGTDITEVVIKNGVKDIGDYVFVNCKNLKSITIPNSVTSIGNRAFWLCSSLKSITIPNSVTSIGDRALCDCSSLKNITIPDSVTSIGYGAFSGCSKSLESIYVGENNSRYTSVNNCLIDKQTKTLILGCKNSVIPSDGSVTSIGDYAFWRCSSLKSITIPDSVTSIGNWAFNECSKLKSVTIPNSVTSIGGNAFGSCSSLKSITIPDSVTSIGNNAFGCYSGSLESIYVGENNARYTSVNNCLIDKQTKTLILGCKNSVIPSDGSVTSIGYRAFWLCSSLKSITIPDSVTSIDYGAFYACLGLKNITIPNSVTSICNNAFCYCSESLESISVGENNVRYTSVNNCLIDKETKTLILGCKNSVIPSDGSVTSIGDYAFVGCSSLKSITIPDSVTIIGNYAFNGCSGLESITISDSVTSIGYGAFSGCSKSLESIYVGENNARYTSVNNCLIDKETITLILGCKNSVIPSDGSVTSIGYRAFWLCSSLKSITIPDSVTSIGYGAFYECSEDLEIYGKYGTAAAKYAKNNDIKFVDKSHSCKSFKTTTTKATFSKNGKTVKTCKTCGKSTSTTIYKVSSVKLSATSYTYNGKAKEPIVTVKTSNEKTLKNGTDYTLSYSNNKNVGSASVKVTLKDNYSGNKTLTFIINPKATSLKSVAGGKKQITVKWNKQATQTTGYQVQYSTSANFKNAKIVTVSNNKTTLKTIKNLTGGKKYYVRVRTYKTVKNTKYYSAWSAKKSAIAKKK